MTQSKNWRMEGTRSGHLSWTQHKGQALHRAQTPHHGTAGCSRQPALAAALQLFQPGQNLTAGPPPRCLSLHNSHAVTRTRLTSPSAKLRVIQSVTEPPAPQARLRLEEFLPEQAFPSSEVHRRAYRKLLCSTSWDWMRQQVIPQTLSHKSFQPLSSLKQSKKSKYDVFPKL